MQAYLGIGTNIGDKRANIERCLKLLGEYAGDIVRQSQIMESAPWGFDSENRFLNMAVCIETKLSPFQLLETTQRTEREMGRKEKSTDGIYHDRIIDIDILLYEDYHITSPTLTIPHPHILERDFVRCPLQEILPSNHFFMRKLLQE